MPRHPIPTPVTIPSGSLVLVTNGTQPVPLQVTKALLERGCRVRVATAWMEDASWLDLLFSPYRRLRMFEHVTVGPGHPHHKSFYRDAVKGVHGIVHSPTLPKFEHEMQDYWEHASSSVTCLLEAAEREPSVKAVVYTSSIVAAAQLVTPTDRLVTEDSWNVEDTLHALTVGQTETDVVRRSAMVRAEQALWDWHKEQRPRFKVNVISPANLIGQNFGAEYTTHWQNWIWQLYKYGFAPEAVPGAGPTQAHWYVDVEDVALLHVAAIFDPAVSGARLQAWGCFRDWNDACAVLQNLEARKQAFPVLGDDGITRGQLYSRITKVPEIFLRWKGKRCWKGFEETIRESLDLFRLMEQQFPEHRGNGVGIMANSYGSVTGNGSVNGNGPSPLVSPLRPMVGSGYFPVGTA